MKKFFLTILVSFVFLGCGCKYSDNDNVLVPKKYSKEDTAAATSPINSHNLDKYLFREDVQYVDLRPGEMILEEGYVAGFSFVPYYSIVASFQEESALYQMKRVVDESGTIHSAGQVGGFVPQYEESESIIKSIFSQNKYIFFISQGGSECAYMINLLIQLGYNGDLLYNVGGITNGEGIKSYKSIETNKYYVEGKSGFNVSVDYNYLDDLTPLQ